MTEVLVLTAPGCHWCEEAQVLLARLSNEFDLHVTIQPADGEEGRALALANGALFPPVIFVNGTYVQYGRPSEKKIRAALRQGSVEAEVVR